MKEEEVGGAIPYLVISVAVVGLLWFQIPQHDDPRLKSDYKLEREKQQAAGEMTVERYSRAGDREEVLLFDIHTQRESKSWISRRLRGLREEETWPVQGMKVDAKWILGAWSHFKENGG